MGQLKLAGLPSKQEAETLQGNPAQLGRVVQSSQKYICPTFAHREKSYLSSAQSKSKKEGYLYSN